MLKEFYGLCSLLRLEVSGNEYKFCGTIVRMIFTRSVLFGEVIVTDKVVVTMRREVKVQRRSCKSSC